MDLPLKQKVFFGLIAVGFLLVVVELVRRRKLAEEYSLLWICSGVLMVLLVVKYDILQWLTAISGAALPTSVLLFLGVFFCVLVVLHLSIRLTRCMADIRCLTQELALLKGETEAGKPASD